MKTKGLSKLLVLGLILLSFTSCKEEEFYEKEFIDTLAEKYERENLPDDIAEAIWEENQQDDPNSNDLETPVSSDDVADNTPDSSTPGDDVVDNGDNPDYNTPDGTTPSTDSGDDVANNTPGSSNPGTDSGNDPDYNNPDGTTPGTDSGDDVADSTPDYNNPDTTTPSTDNSSDDVADNTPDSSTPGTDSGNDPDYNDPDYNNPDTTTPSTDYDGDGVADNGNDTDYNNPDPTTPGTDSGDDVADNENDPDYNTPDTSPVEEENPGVRLTQKEDYFQVQASGQKLDIVWVIDNSKSMADEQKALGENFNAFIKEFVNKGIDFKMAVTTTDTRKNNAGRAYKNSMELLTSDKLAKDKSQFLSDFKKLVNVGENGSSREKGIKASEVFTHRYSNSWIRPDAYLTIVYVSDEEDQSEKSVSGHLKQIQKKKSNTNLVKAYSIVDMVHSRRSGAIRRGYKRYKEISELTGGEVASIKKDFYDTLLKMGEQIANLSQSYPLTQTPYSAESIKVLINGEPSTNWTYNAETNTVIFNDQSELSEDSLISVSYDVEDTN